MFGRQLNNDQFDGLADLCFDLAKGALIFAILPISDLQQNLFLSIIKIFIGLFWGLASTYFALLLLGLKKGKI